MKRVLGDYKDVAGAMGSNAVPRALLTVITEEARVRVRVQVQVQETRSSTRARGDGEVTLQLAEGHGQ